MKVKVLASGSKGNSTFISINNTNLLIDIGMRCNYIEKELNKIDVSPKDIDAILITHTHTDHIMGLKVFNNKYKTKVYLTDNMDVDVVNRVRLSNDFYINNVHIISFKTSHDVDSVGYIINDEIVYITDTGYINNKYFDMLSNKYIYIIESNHDTEMLETGPYPYHLKQRIWSAKGHLSNTKCMEYLNKFIGSNTKYIVFAHLSETNNKEEIVINEFNKLNINNVNVIVAKQNEGICIV